MSLSTRPKPRASSPLRASVLASVAASILGCSTWMPSDRNAASMATPVSSPRAEDAKALRAMPIYFEPNAGQADASVRFISRGPSHALWLTAREAVVAPIGGDGEAVTLGLVGARAEVEVRGIDPLPGRVNYLIGNDRSRWRTDLPTYGAVEYRGVYPGVDLVYHGRQGQLEFDFVVAPHADPRPIRLRLAGVAPVRLDERGDLVVGAGDRQVRLRKPVVYQEIDGRRREIAGRYVYDGGAEVRFAVAEYDRRVALVIDPILQATYIGGTSNELRAGLSIDPAGNIYVAGSTISTDYPLQNPLQSTNFGFGNGSCFITKLTPAGNALVYSTYLGGHGDNGCFSRAVADASGSVYVTGPTSANDFPVTANAFQSTRAGSFDVFVSRLAPAGNTLLYSTYLGGTGFDNSRGLAADDAGHVWVSGITQSLDFPVKNAIQPSHAPDFGNNDAFVTKLDTNLIGPASLVFSTYFGGNNADNGDGVSVGGGLAVDPAGNAIAALLTRSTDLVTSPGALQPAFGGGTYDAFVLKLGPTGNRVYATYLGGTGDDLGFTVAADAAGNAYVSGTTTGANFPLKNPVQGAYGGGASDAFVSKLNAQGALVYSTFLGGNGSEFPGYIAVDGAGNVYVTGNTSSANFPLVAPIQAAYGGGGVDAFVTQINSAGSAIAFSTYLGGFGDDTGYGIAVDGGGNVYVSLETNSSNLPVANPFQATLRGGFDAYIAKISLPAGGLVASILPIGRSVQTGGTATVFATIINTGADAAVGCSIAPVTALPVTPLYQTTDRFTNALTGNPNTPANIAAGDFQTFLIAITANAAFGPTDVAFSFGCANRASATPIPGVNTLLLSASDTPVPDIVALGLTPSGDGIVNVPGTNGTGFFTVATSNVGGVGGTIKVKPDTGGAALPVNLFVCQTDPGSGACLGALQSEIFVTINPGQTPTFAAFAQGAGDIAFNPAANRLFLRFYDAGGAVRGATSAALRTQ